MARVPASNRRVATKPRAKPSCWRLTIENRASAVPMAAKPFTRSSSAARLIWLSTPGLAM